MFRARSVVAGLLFIAVCAGAIGALAYKQEIRDQWRYSAYTPSDTVAQLASRSGMSERGKFYFYVAHPELESAEGFNDDCRRAEQGSPILGCYKTGSDTIHIYDISNDELDGVKEVTAAHEMLHVVFARLKQSELANLTTKLEEAYVNVRTDKLDERLAYYDRNSPGSRVNELHSIIATEYSDIGPELEEYYQRYFSDRQKVVRLHASYSQKFDDIEREINQLLAQLSGLESQINSEIVSHRANVSDLNIEIETFNQRAENGFFRSQSEFNLARNQLNQRISALESRRLNIEAMVDDYNNKVARLNQLGGKMDELQKGLDSLETVNGSVEKT